MTSGCAPAGYRLAGAHLQHVCSKHLRGNDRMLTAWPQPDHATILLLGPHDRSVTDVYDMLLVALEVAVSTEDRAKPSCCDEVGEPPADQAAAEAVADAVERLARSRRRS